MAVEEPRYDDDLLQSWAPELTDRRLEEVTADLEGDALTFFVFENAEGDIVGFSCAVPAEGEVRAVYVSPEASGRGLGSGLLRQAEWAATQEGHDELQIHASLNAVPFYESHGYEPRDEVEHELDDGTNMLCVRMTKEVEQGMDATW